MTHNGKTYDIPESELIKYEVKPIGSDNNLYRFIYADNIYICKKAVIDLNELDESGNTDIYDNITYLGLDNNQVVIGYFEGIYDDNNSNKYGCFDSSNYSDNLFVRMSNGDDVWLDDLYEIIYTTNEYGEAKSWDGSDIVYADLIGKFKANI